MIPSRSKWRQTMRRTKMARMEKASWCPTSLIRRCTDIRRRRFTRLVLVCFSWPLNGRKICRALRVWRFAIRWFCWRSRGQRCSCWTLFNGVCPLNRRAVRCFLSRNIAATITTTTRHLKTSKTRWDRWNFQQRKCVENVIKFPSADCTRHPNASRYALSLQIDSRRSRRVCVPQSDCFVPFGGERIERRNANREFAGSGAGNWHSEMLSLRRWICNPTIMNFAVIHPFRLCLHSIVVRSFPRKLPASDGSCWCCRCFDSSIPRASSPSTSTRRSATRKWRKFSVICIKIKTKSFRAIFTDVGPNIPFMLLRIGIIRRKQMDFPYSSLSHSIYNVINSH